LTVEEKITMIGRFEKAAEAFDDLAGLSAGILAFRPFEDAWTAHEHAVHCLEVDAAFFHRYRRAVAQPGTAVLPFDRLWTAALEYHAHDLKMTLELIRALRRYMAAHLRTLVPRDWKQFAYIHPEQGRVDLENAVSRVIDHVRFHRELIDRNLGLWAGKNATQEGANP
jgi:hypothetical protein